MRSYLSRIIEPHANGCRGHATYDGVRLDIPGYDRAGRRYSSAADSNSCKHYAAKSKPNVILYYYGFCSPDWIGISSTDPTTEPHWDAEAPEFVVVPADERHPIGNQRIATDFDIGLYRYVLAEIAVITDAYRLRCPETATGADMHVTATVSH